MQLNEREFPSIASLSGTLPAVTKDILLSTSAQNITSGLRRWIGQIQGLQETSESDPLDRLSAINSEIESLISSDDTLRRKQGLPECKCELLDTEYFFSHARMERRPISEIEKGWISTFLKMSVALLAAESVTCSDLRRFDSIINKFNEDFPNRGWGFSTVIFSQLALNRFELGEALRATLRLSGRGTRLPGIFGFRMAAMTLFLLGMHVKSSLDNEIEADLRPFKSLRKALEVIVDPENRDFTREVPIKLRNSIREELKTGLVIFLYGSLKFWSTDREDVKPLRTFISANIGPIINIVEEFSSKRNTLPSLFIYAGSRWLHNDLFTPREIKDRIPTTWDKIFLRPFYRDYFGLGLNVLLTGRSKYLAWHYFHDRPVYDRKNGAEYDNLLDALARLK